MPEAAGAQRRLVLDSSVTEEKFYPIAKIQGWLWWKTIEEMKDHPREVIFATLDKKTSVHFVDDSYLETRFLIFRGAEASAAHARALEVVAHRPDEEVLEAAKAAAGEARADSLLALAAIAAQLDRGRVVEAFRVAALAREPMVRRAAIVAMGYMGWPELRELAEAMAASDPDQGIREDASALLEGYDLQDRGLI